MRCAFVLVAVLAATAQALDVDMQAPVSVTFLLPHCDAGVEYLRVALDRTSDPTHAEYLNHMSREEVHARLAPCDGTQQRLAAWLSSHAIPRSHAAWSPSKSIVVAALPLHRAADVLEWTPSPRRHPSNTSLALVTADVRLPAHHPLAGTALPTVLVRGQVPVVTPTPRPVPRALRRDGVGGSMNVLAYQYKSFPLPPVLMAENLNGVFVVEVAPQCSTGWPASYSVPVSDLGTNLFSCPYDDPCGTGDQLLSFDFELKPLTPGAGETHTFSRDASASRCFDLNFGVPYTDEFATCNEITEKATLGVCGFETFLTLPQDVPYTITVTQHMASGTTFSYDYTAQGSGAPLGVINSEAMTPSAFRTYYNIPARSCVSDSRVQNAIGVPQPQLSGFYSPGDVASFDSNMGEPNSAGNLRFESQPALSTELLDVYRAMGLTKQTSEVKNNAGNPGGETTLDVEWITAVAPGALTTVWHGGFYDFSAPTNMELCWGIAHLIEVVLMVETAAKPPAVLSLSYGYPESDMDTMGLLPFFNNHFMSMGNQGISVIVASGDDGSHFRSMFLSGDVCSSQQPAFPASSPYVTAVGATMRAMNATTSTVEEVVASIATGSLITSGGGFSTAAAAQSYQQAAVAAYVQSGVPDLPAFNASNRGFPDVSAYGHSFTIVMDGKVQYEDGTSASAPSFAGIVTLLNDILARMNPSSSDAPPTLGFLNPALYQAAASDASPFNDITSGDNKCIGHSSLAHCCNKGYAAARGWDPVSGLGSVDAQKLAAALLPAGWDTTGFTSSNCASHGGSSGGWPTWATAVIVVVVVVVAVGGAVWFARRRRRRHLHHHQPSQADAYQPFIQD